MIFKKLKITILENRGRLQTTNFVDFYHLPSSLQFKKIIDAGEGAK